MLTGADRCETYLHLSTPIYTYPTPVQCEQCEHLANGQDTTPRGALKMARKPLRDPDRFSAPARQPRCLSRHGAVAARTVRRIAAALTCAARRLRGARGRTGGPAEQTAVTHTSASDLAVLLVGPACRSPRTAIGAGRREQTSSEGVQVKSIFRLIWRVRQASSIPHQARCAPCRPLDPHDTRVKPAHV